MLGSSEDLEDSKPTQLSAENSAVSSLHALPCSSEGDISRETGGILLLYCGSSWTDRPDEAVASCPIMAQSILFISMELTSHSNVISSFLLDTSCTFNKIEDLDTDC